MARMEGPKKLGLFRRIVYWFARRRLGRVPVPLQITAHHRGVLLGVAAFELTQERARTVDARLKALADLKAASMIGYPF